MNSNEDDLHMLDASPQRSPRRRQDLEAPAPTASLLGSALPRELHYGSTINGFDGAGPTSSPYPDRQRSPSAFGDPVKPDLDGQIVDADRLREHLSFEHPMADLGDLGDTLASLRNEEDEDEHEQLVPYKSFLPTGYCYDVRMRYHCELEPPKERRELHPEDPRRIFKIYQELCIAGLIKNEQLNQGFVIPNPLVNIPARHVTEGEVALVHDKKMFDRMKATKTMRPEDLLILEREHDSIYFNTTTFNCALLSAGGTIETCKAVVSGQIKNAIAIVRPPGHHAECNRPMGFCIFDNVAIATKVCQLDYGADCQKVLILDWDVHHGNGIQQAFYSDPNVLYISLHVHEDGNFYPQGPYGDHLHCGSGEGLGKNINIPWPTKGMGDAEYLFAFQHLVMPVASAFDPDLVIIAAGFDAAEGDQLGGCHVSPACYAHMTHMLMSLAKGKLVVCLEGGYNLRSISKSALAVTRTLVGEIPDRITPVRPKDSAITMLHKVATQQSQFWSCIYPKDLPRTMLEETGAQRMHDVVRYYQAAKLQEAHNMINLNIYQEKLSQSFENQVMATPNFEQDVPLLVIFHDPPEVMEIANPVSKKLELHDTWLADGVKFYIDWAVQHGMAVIDVNVPRYLTDQDEEDGYSEDNKHGRILDIQKLAIYLWDNYIECNDATQVFFLGVGSAYQGIVYLMNNRTQAFTDSTFGIVSFIDSTIVPAGDQLLYDNPKWYRATSLNFVAKDHLLWQLEGKKKSGKRFGNLLKSQRGGINDMVVAHREEVTEWIGERLVRRG